MLNETIKEMLNPPVGGQVVECLILNEKKKLVYGVIQHLTFKIYHYFCVLCGYKKILNEKKS